jgi:hypothetical protein
MSPLLQQPTEDFRHHALVALFGRADKDIILDMQGVPGALEHLRHLVDELLRRHAALLGNAMHFGGVLVRACEKVDRAPAPLLEPRAGVGDNRRQRSADMRHAVDIVNRRRDVVALHAQQVVYLIVRRTQTRLPYTPDRKPSHARTYHPTGAPGGTRTHNQRLRRPLLCPLSYGGAGSLIIHHARARNNPTICPENRRNRFRTCPLCGGF